MLGVHKRGILIIDPETNEFSRIVTFEENMKSWSFMANSFIIVVDDTKLVFQGEDNLLINDLMLKYTERLAESNTVQKAPSLFTAKALKRQELSQN